MSEKGFKAMLKTFLSGLSGDVRVFKGLIKDKMYFSDNPSPEKVLEIIKQVGESIKKDIDYSINTKKNLNDLRRGKKK